MKILFSKRISAFTLIEMLTVVFIVGIVASITLANYRGGGRRSDLITVAQNVASVFRRAQSMALTGYPAASGSPGDAYGVYATSTPTNIYTLFIDLDGSYRWDGSPTDELVQTFTLPTNFQFQSVGCTDLSFTKPYGVVYCDGVALAVNQDKIY
ncbi:MAG: type II secretion system protein, partial [Candidatus Parcubacteria bacterium]|nr:type II secretion system protein [Candidatus Parcubacteria bacterium]